MLKSLIKPRNNRGDTIVEVLIAIAVAAFAIGTAYAIANRSLQQAITARERNEAVNIIQSQISALKIRYTYDKTAFSGDDLAKNFIVPASTIPPAPSSLPYTAFHFCLDPVSASPDDKSHPWSKLVESGFTDSDADNISPTNKYRSECSPTVGSTQYFIDISAQITAGSLNSINRTVYKFAVRWNQVGNTSPAQSVVYYRI